MVEVLLDGSGVVQFGLTLNCADHRLGFELVSIVTIERCVLCSSSHYYLLEVLTHAITITFAFSQFYDKIIGISSMIQLTNVPGQSSSAACLHPLPSCKSFKY